MPASKAREREELKYIKVTKITIRTTATAGVPLTLRIPTSTKTDPWVYTTITLPPKSPEASAAVPTTIHVTVLTRVIYEVLDKRNGVFQTLTLTQTSPGEAVSTIITIHEPDSSVLHSTSGTIMGSQSLSTLPPDTVPSLTATRTSSLISASNSLTSTLSTAPAVGIIGKPGINNDEGFPVVVSVMFAFSALCILFMWAMSIKQMIDERREASENLRLRKKHDAPNLAAARQNHLRESLDFSDPVVADYAARVRAAEVLMETMQQRNRAEKAKQRAGHTNQE